MAQFGGFDDNWGLQAIVRGSSTTTTTTFSAAGGGGGCGPGYNDENGFIFGDENIFQNHHQVTTMLTDHDDFQHIYQPFYPVWDSSSSSPNDHQHIIPTSNDMKFQESYRKQLISSPRDQSTSATARHTPKYKRRKNQQKRVVVESGAGAVTASDMWAWRKYGQKPIKGSPYPRSYYRCSTSKSCIAKKQMEQSCTEPGVNIITYTAEHNHSQPMRKNALAGTTRQKFPTSTQQVISPPAVAAARSSRNYSSYIKDEESDDVQRASINGVSVKEELRNIEEIKMEEEFFAGLEDLDGLFSELVGVGNSGQRQQHHQYSSSPTSKMFSINFYNY